LTLHGVLSNTNQQNKNSIVAIYTGNFFQMSYNSMIQAGRVMVKSGGGLSIQGHIISTIQNTCNTMSPSQPHDLFYCVPKHAQYSEFEERTVVNNFQRQFGFSQQDYTAIEDIFGFLSNNYTIYLLSYGTITLSSFHIQGSRIGLCAENINANFGTVDATGRGCPSDQGLGHGNIKDGCAGGGGANGGYAGYGGGESTDPSKRASCKQLYANTFFDYDNDASYEGSGGASSRSNEQNGGNGGGLIWITASNSVTVNDASFSSEGQDGINKEGTYLGSGGGAGGSILLLTGSLAGNGNFSVKGGDGSYGAGGGGSGGRLLVNYLRGYSSKSYPQLSANWKGDGYIQGGQPGDVAEKSSIFLSPGNAGQWGTIWTTKCLGGFSGAFCSPCPTGYFKYDYSYSQCEPCNNKPVNSYYVGVGAANSECSYQCNAGYDPVSVNPNCVNEVELFVENLGGATIAIIFFAVMLLLTLSMWICLIRRDSIRKKESRISKVQNLIRVTENSEGQRT